MKTRLLLTFIAITFALNSWANDIEIGSIHYLLDSTSKTAGVTYTGEITPLGEFYNSNTYSGKVTIPASVTIEGSIYSVTYIGEYAFNGCI